MSLRINDEAPNFTAETTQGKLNFHDWIGNGWAVLFSHPKDFTPVCTTELGYMAGLTPEFEKRNSKDHRPQRRSGRRPHPLVKGHRGDPGPPRHLPADRRSRAQGREALRHAAGRSRRHSSQGRTAANNATVRSVFVIGPDKKIKAMLTYPMTTGRNFDEVLRILDSVQLTAKHPVATPVNWKPGEDVIIAGSVSDEEAQKRYPGFRAPKPYLRYTAQPR